jgi:cupin 2 domain-containing protein
VSTADHNDIVLPIHQSIFNRKRTQRSQNKKRLSMVNFRQDSRIYRILNTNVLSPLIRAIPLSCLKLKIMNLFENIPKNAPEELVTELFSAESLRVERIVSFGQSSPDGFWYDQKENEWVLLIEGSAQVQFENRLQDLKPGDWVNIPAGCQHRVEKTDENVRTVWLAIFYK